MIEGVFLGWKMNPGGRWSGLYCVAAIEDFDVLPLLRGQEDHRHVVFAQDTHRVTLDKGYDFPLRERYLLENGTLIGRQTALDGPDPDGGAPEPVAVHCPTTQQFRTEDIPGEPSETSVGTRYGEREECRTTSVAPAWQHAWQ